MKCLLILCSILICQGIYAQSRFEGGLIVLNTGDTLRGQVYYRDNLSPASTVRFRTGPGTVAVIYAVTRLHYMEAAGKDPYQRVFLSGDTLLVRVLVAGKDISLYECDSATSRFYIKTHDEYTELVYHEHLSADGAMVFENDTFRDQLKQYAAGAGHPELTARIDHTSYSRDALMSVVEAMDGIRKNVDTGSSGLVFRPFVMAGAFFARLRQFDNTNTAFGTPANKTMPAGAIGVDMAHSRNSGDFAARMEVAYWGGSFTGALYTPHGDYVRYTLKTSTIVPSLSALFYFCRQKQLRLYAAGGIGANITSFPTSDYTVIPNGGAVETVAVNNRSFWIEPQFRLGGQIVQKIAIEVLWAPYTQINNSAYGHADISMLALRVGYHLMGSH